MSEFRPRSVCILGRQPKLGLAELESLYGASRVRAAESAAVLDIPVQEIDFKRLGGTMKIAQVLTVLPSDKWQDLLQYLIEKIPEHLQHVPNGKFTLGLSTYGIKVNLNEQTRGLMSIKRAIKTSGRSVRIVPNKELVLNSAQILHNKLTTRGAWELLLVRWGSKVLLAQSIFVQDIEAYAARDQARPARDARVGMLPPKLAQLMINFVKPPAGGTVLDPFCGSGVILQEALLMNYKVVGSDADSRMVNFALKNMGWLSSTHELPAANYQVVQADAQIHKWKIDIGAVVSEIYLGKPLVKLPATEELHKIAREVNELLKKFLANLQPQIRSGTRLCLAVPLWRTKTGFVRLPVIDHLTDMGYNQLDFKHAKADDLVYYRKDQIVARQLIVLEKR